MPRIKVHGTSVYVPFGSAHLPSILTTEAPETALLWSWSQAAVTAEVPVCHRCGAREALSHGDWLHGTSAELASWQLPRDASDTT